MAPEAEPLKVQGSLSPPCRYPVLAALLSAIFPGLGQWYNGERIKAFAIGCMSIGTYVGILLAIIGPKAFHSLLTLVLLGIVYLAIWIPAVMDAYQRAAGVATTVFSSTSYWYVIVMLLTVGPMALPLLWQSHRFSKAAKISYSLIVIVVALCTIGLIVVLAPILEQFQEIMPQLYSP
ncbi:MAG: hypothetical protein HYU33_06715 [Candidatus Omnitrophica bacterium]|nr:hypothetical protein [Candidatus Omnitrophota bacterium]